MSQREEKEETRNRNTVSYMKVSKLINFKKHYLDLPPLLCQPQAAWGSSHLNGIALGEMYESFPQQQQPHFECSVAICGRVATH